MCAANHGKPRVMVQYKENDIRTALTVAHELGHLLGMYHDFEKPSERLHKCGKGKFKGGTVMNYGNNRTVWSECSQDDFKLYYNKVLLKNDDKFCLQEVSEAAGKCRPFSPFSSFDNSLTQPSQTKYIFDLRDDLLLFRCWLSSVGATNLFVNQKSWL